MDVPVIMQKRWFATMQFLSSSPDLVDIPVRNRSKTAVGAMKGFSPHFASFFEFPREGLSPGVIGFFEPSMTKSFFVVEGSPECWSRREFYSKVTRHQDCAY